MPQVLVVDDDRLVCWSLEQTLRREGYGVSSVDSAEKALEKLEGSRFDVAIVDVVLPGMDGLGLIGWMRLVSPGIKTIVITGHGSREVERKALEHGAFAYVEKPFSLKEVIGLVKRALLSPGLAQGQGGKYGT